MEGGTIFAVSSPPGRGASAFLRLSGPDAVAIAGAICAGEGRRTVSSLPGFRGAPVALRVGPDAGGIDAEGIEARAWVTVYRRPRSYTCEDMVEVALPGSAPLVGLVAKALVAAGARWAGPGEFTLRAFQNGRIDLSQAEAVASLIAAAGEDEARASRRGLRGDLRRRLEEVREEVVETLALIEAALDFPDEELPQVSSPVLEGRIRGAAGRLDGLRSSTALRSPKDGSLRVVLAGFPNAGKSSLLNALVGREVALTAGLPGTTRDPLRAVRTHSGRRIEWIDVAGSFDDRVFSAGPPPDGLSSLLEEENGEDREKQADWEDPALLAIVRRLTRIEIETADRVVWVADPADRLEESLAAYGRLAAPGKVLVIQKADLLDEEGLRSLAARPESPVIVSARARRGLDDLAARVMAAAGPSGGGAAPPLFLVSAHQETWLEAAAAALSRAGAVPRAGAGLELAAADLRDALRALEELIGLTPREAILDHLFARFCVGK